MSDCRYFTPAQIRYMIHMLRLSENGIGVKNSELAKTTGVSKPSVHKMLRSLSDMGVISQKSFGLAHLTDYGREAALRYENGYCVLDRAIVELCGEGAVSEDAICGLMSDMSESTLDGLQDKNK